jgi:hypothetical protein
MRRKGKECERPLGGKACKAVLADAGTKEASIKIEASSYLK